MATKDVDRRDLWRKLLDPIRGDFAEDVESDEMLLRQVIHDIQWFTQEHSRLSKIVQDQARLLRREGLGGY